MAAAFIGFASDAVDPVERWGKVQGRYAPLVALLNRNAGYAEQCETMPIGFGGEIARLATRMEGAPFGNERFASFAVGMWAAFEWAGDETAADRTAIVLARRLSRDSGPASLEEVPVLRKKGNVKQ